MHNYVKLQSTKLGTRHYLTFLAREIFAVSSLGFDLSTGFFQIQVRSGQCELNTRPIDLQSIALPTELYPATDHYMLYFLIMNNIAVSDLMCLWSPP